MQRLLNLTMSHSWITQMETLLAGEQSSCCMCRGTCSSCVQTGRSELTGWSATTSTQGRPLWPGSCKPGQGSSWAATYRGPTQGHSTSSSSTSCHTGHQGPTNAACHSPSGGPSISPHPGGSWEAGHRPALNKDILTFASGFSATTILKEW